MKKVLIFENQRYDIENTFNFINLIKFSNTLEFVYLNTSQELISMDSLNDYDLIVIDLDLSSQSKKDGYGILDDIKNFDSNLLQHCFILTGSTKVKENLKKFSLEEIEVVSKPVEIDELVKVMKKRIKR